MRNLSRAIEDVGYTTSPFICNRVNEYITPINVAHSHVNSILYGKDGNLIYEPTNKNKILAICKDGVYIVETINILMRDKQWIKEYPDENIRFNELLDRIHGLATSKAALEISNSNVYGRSNFNGNIHYCGDMTSKISVNDAFERFKLLEEVQGMKFDLVIGNPPYQEDIGRKQSSPLYDKFIEKAIDLDPHYISFIVKNDWLHGNTFSEIRNRLSKKLDSIVAFDDCTIVFGNTMITGGVNYFLYNENHTGQCTITNISKEGQTKYSADIEDNIFTNQIQYSLFNKVKKYEKISSRISSQTPFGLKSNSIDDLSALPFDECIEVIGGNGKQAYIHRNEVAKRAWDIDNWKVCINMAVSGGMLGGIPYKVIPCPRKLGPGQICTQTYLVISVKNEILADNLIGYLKTRFARFMLYLGVSGVTLSPSNFEFIPVVDFSHPWTDEMLDKEFGITAEERNYINRVIKPIE